MWKLINRCCGNICSKEDDEGKSLGRDMEWMTTTKDDVVLQKEESKEPALGIPATYADQASTLKFYLNGELREISNPDPTMVLVDYIRNVEGLTGTKASCREGGCGSCTVAMSVLKSDKWETKAINSCLTPVCTLDGAKITTIEGIGSQEKGYHDVQKRLSVEGSQCGFCSPGIAMNMYAMLCSDTDKSAEAIENRFDGNICRCTGYRSIFDAMQTFAEPKTCDGVLDIEDINCQNCVAREGPDHCKGVRDAQDRKMRKALLKKGHVTYKNDNGIQWITLQDLTQLYDMMNKHNNKYELVSGNTAIAGVEKYYDGTAWGFRGPDRPTVLVDITRIPSLSEVTIESNTMTIGSNTSLTSLIDLLAQCEANSEKAKFLKAHLLKVANVQVRDVGSVGGNIAMAVKYKSFPSDLLIIFAAAGVEVSVGDAGTGKEETISIEKLDGLKDKVIISFSIPHKSSAENGSKVIFKTYKVMSRHQNSHAIVNAGFQITLDSAEQQITSARIFYGGVKPCLSHAPLTEAALVGKDFSAKTFSEAMKVLEKEVVPAEDDRQYQYKKSLVSCLAYKFAIHALPNVHPSVESAGEDFVRPLSCGKMEFPKGEKEEYPISFPITKWNALHQTAGELKYTDDLPPCKGTLYGAFVLSTCASCETFEMDYSEAMQYPGVVQCVDAKALSAAGILNTFYNKEELFASKEILYAGQRIALILADSEQHANEACNLVKVSYHNVNDNPILTIEDAIEQKSFFSAEPTKFTFGSASDALSKAPVRVKGSTSCGHQHHFHVETHTANATVTANGITINSATQAPGEIASCVSECLGVTKSSVEVKMLQAGGGFGGKGSRSTPVALAAAIASKVTGLPIRVKLDLNANLASTGSRRPHRFDYDIGVDSDGRILAVTGTMYYLQGAHLDSVDTGGLNQITLGIDGAYSIANWSIDGFACKANTPTNTWCRSPILLPATFMIEQMLDHVSYAVGKSPEEVRLLNLYKVNDVTPIGIKLAHCTVGDCWDLLMSKIDWESRMADIAKFNQSNMWVKRGLSVIPQKYVISQCKNFPAFVSIQEDGTVLVQHSGCEIGQGMHTKVMQAAATKLGIDMKLIHVGETSSRVAPTICVTGGSITSEAVCASTILACDELVSRMKDVKEQMKNADWQDIVSACYSNGVDLHVFKTYQGQKESDLPEKEEDIAYVSYGVSAVEVRVDILTGEVQILRCDIVQDCGVSMNPRIDMGQTQGAYVMGLGYMLTEEFLWDDGSSTGAKGMNLSNGTWEYKPPCSQDIPIEFNASFLPDSKNTNGVFSSKTVGEPPLLLACGLVTAIRKAVGAYRSDIQLDPYVALHAPVTVEKIHLAANRDDRKRNFILE